MVLIRMFSSKIITSGNDRSQSYDGHQRKQQYIQFLAVGRLLAAMKATYPQYPAYLDDGN